VPAAASGFGLDPLEAETFWRLTPAVIERARRYGILGEIRTLGKWLGVENTEMDPLEVAIEKAKAEILAETDNKYEMFIALDKSGQIVLKKKGRKREVAFTPEEGNKLLEHAYIGIHNHPGETSFSDADLALACDKRIERMIVTSNKFDYELHFKGKWPNPREIKRKWKKLFFSAFLKKDKSMEEAKHEAVSKLAQEYGFKYQRISKQ